MSHDLEDVGRQLDQSGVLLLGPAFLQLLQTHLLPALQALGGSEVVSLLEQSQRSALGCVALGKLACPAL